MSDILASKGKLSRQNIKDFDETIVVFLDEWKRLKTIWTRSDDTREIDEAFYRWMKAWLALDRIIDDQTHAHALPYWKIQDLQPLRESSSKLQSRLARIDDVNRRQRIVKLAKKALDELTSKLAEET